MKKKMIITLVIVVVIALGFWVGYQVVTSKTSPPTDSFYQSDTTEKAWEEGQNKEESSDKTMEESIESIENMDFSKIDIKGMMESISVTDKLAVMNILGESLAAKDYKELIGMLGGGIDSGEVQRAKNILNENLSKEDKEKIFSYYKKYADLLDE